MQTKVPRVPIWQRMIAPIVSSAPVASFLRRTMHLMDRPLLRLSGGRLSFVIGYPVLLLTTTGAKSGQLRTVPLLYVEWDGGVAIIGSRFGSTKHPGWYHNLRADPKATIEIKGERRECVARPARDDEREEIWRRAIAMYAGYEKYRARAGRTIPIMVLTPVGESGHAG